MKYNLTYNIIIVKKYIYYDSLNNNTLYKHHEQFLKKLFPTYNFEKNYVKFPTVQ